MQRERSAPPPPPPADYYSANERSAPPPPPPADYYSARRCAYYRVRGHCSRPIFSRGCAHTCFQRYGYHRPSYAAYLDQQARRGVLHVASAEESRGFEKPFAQLSGALLPDGSVRGAMGADQLLPFVAADRGLLLMSSTRQGLAEFATAARMLALSSRELALSALLLVCNNASLGNDSLARWLALFRSPPLLRMWVHTRKNIGYLCGNLHGIAASVRVWMRFPWVLHMSGPDSLLVPRGAALLSALIEKEQQCSRLERTPHRHTAYLGDRFPAPRGHVRFSMDVFVFWPRAMGQRVVECDALVSPRLRTRGRGRRLESRARAGARAGR
eukprot:3086483-Prymnesium_polylepis.2